MDEPVAESVWDHFDNTWVKDFAGLSLEAAIQRAEAERRPVRTVRWATVSRGSVAVGVVAGVLHPGSDVTLDFRPDRLNLRLDASGDLQDVSAG